MVTGKKALVALVAVGIAAALGVAGSASAATKRRLPTNRLGDCVKPSLIGETFCAATLV